MIKIFFKDKENIYSELWVSNISKNIFGLSGGQYITETQAKKCIMVDGWLLKIKRIMKKEGS